MAGLGAEHLPRELVEELDRVAPALALGLLAVLLGEVAVVDRASPSRPWISSTSPRSRIHAGPERGQPGLGSPWKAGVAPGARGVVDADGLVGHLCAVRQAGGGERDLAHGHPQVGAGAGEVDAAGGGEEPVPGAGASFDWDMGGMLWLRPATAGGSQIPPLRGRPCFPYGVVRRIRFEGFGGGSRRHLSPGPRALLNEDVPNVSPDFRAYQLESSILGETGAVPGVISLQLVLQTLCLPTRCPMSLPAVAFPQTLRIISSRAANS